MADCLNELAGRMRRREIVMIFSDFFTDLASLEPALQRLRYNRHEVVLFQVMHHDELAFEFDGMIKFVGLEDSRGAARPARRPAPRLSARRSTGSTTSSKRSASATAASACWSTPAATWASCSSTISTSEWRWPACGERRHMNRWRIFRLAASLSPSPLALFIWCGFERSAVDRAAAAEHARLTRATMLTWEILSRRSAPPSVEMASVPGNNPFDVLRVQMETLQWESVGGPGTVAGFGLRGIDLVVVSDQEMVDECEGEQASRAESLANASGYQLLAAKRNALTEDGDARKHRQSELGGTEARLRDLRGASESRPLAATRSRSRDAAHCPTSPRICSTKELTMT